MNNVDLALIDSINEVASRRFALEVELEQKNATFKTDQAVATARHNAQIAPLQAAISRTDAELWTLIGENRDTLTKSGRKSFATMVAKFQFRTVRGKPKVIDTDGLMEAARHLGIVRKIARQVTRWKLDPQKFFAWLKTHGEYRAELEEFIDDLPDNETLTIAPNGTYTVVYDDMRISPPSITIKES